MSDSIADDRDAATSDVEHLLGPLAPESATKMPGSWEWDDIKARDSGLRMMEDEGPWYQRIVEIVVDRLAAEVVRFQEKADRSESASNDATDEVQRLAQKLQTLTGRVDTLEQEKADLLLKYNALKLQVANTPPRTVQVTLPPPGTSSTARAPGTQVISTVGAASGPKRRVRRD